MEVIADGVGSRLNHIMKTFVVIQECISPQIHSLNDSECFEIAFDLGFILMFQSFRDSECFTSACRFF